MINVIKSTNNVVLYFLWRPHHESKTYLLLRDTILLYNNILLGVTFKYGTTYYYSLQAKIYAKTPTEEPTMKRNIPKQVGIEMYNFKIVKYLYL